MYDITGLSSSTTSGTVITSSSISLTLSNNIVNTITQISSTPYSGSGRPVAVRITNTGNSGMILLSVVIGLGSI